MYFRVVANFNLLFFSFLFFFFFFGVFSILASGIDEGRYRFHVGENIRRYRLHASPETQIVVRMFEIFHSEQYVNLYFPFLTIARLTNRTLTIKVHIKQLTQRTYEFFCS